MQLVQTITVGAAGTSQIEFTAIPQTATDLLVAVSPRGNQFDNRSLMVRVNNNTGGQYTYRRLAGSGSASSQDSANGGTSFEIRDVVPGPLATASTFANVSLYFPNYTSTTTNKLMSADGVGENNAAGAWQSITSGRVTNNAAITSIQLLIRDSTNFVEGSTASLYTITKA